MGGGREMYKTDESPRCSGNPPSTIQLSSLTLPIPNTTNPVSPPQTNTTNMPTDAQIAGGHKANLKNPNTSDESKQNSRNILDNEFNGGDGKLGSAKL
jgi:hypothetical protein